VDNALHGISATPMQLLVACVSKPQCLIHIPRHVDLLLVSLYFIFGETQYKFSVGIGTLNQLKFWLILVLTRPPRETS